METLRQLSQGRTLAREAGNLEAGALTIAATHALSFLFFPEWLGLIGSSAPAGSIQLVSDNMQACEQVLRKGHAQFLLCHYHPAAPPQLDEGAFRAITVGRDAIVLAAAPALIAAKNETLDYLGYSDVSGLGRILAAVHEAHGHAPPQPPVLSSHLAAVLRSMALNGRGMAWLPLSMIRADLELGKLQIIETAISPIDIDIRLIRPRECQSRAAEAAWDNLSARYIQSETMPSAPQARGKRKAINSPL